MATTTEREIPAPGEPEEIGSEAEPDEESLPYEGGLVRLETPGSELAEE